MGLPWGLPKSLEVMYPQLMYFKHHREACHVAAVLEAAESWVLSRAAVSDQPHCTALNLIKEVKVCACCSTPCQARVLQGRADLCLIEDLQPLAVKEP